MANRIPTLKEYEQMGYTTIEQIYESLENIIMNKNMVIAELQKELQETQATLAANAGTNTKEF